MGLTRRDSRLAIVWQSTLLAIVGLVVGVPLGIVVGRYLWRQIVDSFPLVYVAPLALVARDPARPDRHRDRQPARCRPGASRDSDPPGRGAANGVTYRRGAGGIGSLMRFVRVLQFAVVAVIAVGGSTDRAGAEQSAATPGMPQLLAGRLDAGSSHTCIVDDGSRVRCWGAGGTGQLGYGNTNHIGDTEHPSTAGVVDLGPGVRVVSVAAGSGHTCAIADDSAVRCWGLGFGGRPRVRQHVSIGDDEKPAVAGAVQLGRRVRAITAGGYHTCAILDDWTVRCWGVGFTYFGSGHLGYGNTLQIGDDETPGSVGPVDLGAGRTARAITAGENHTCAILDAGAVRCWGSVLLRSTGLCRCSRTSATTRRPEHRPGGPRSWAHGHRHQRRQLPHLRDPRRWLGAVLGERPRRPRRPRSRRPGDRHRRRERAHLCRPRRRHCALLGRGARGKLGYGNLNDIGDDEAPGSAGPVDLGPGRRATAITAGPGHTCAALDDGRIRCWGTHEHGATASTATRGRSATTRRRGNARR